VLKSYLKDIAVYLIMCVATLLILQTIIAYSSFETNVGFLQQKQAYLTNTVWRIAFYVHVFTSVFTLFAGFTQFSSFILTEYKKLHRIIGKLYVVIVLFINVPSGFILAIYANGFLPSKIAFLVLDILWCWFTYMAWHSVINKKFKEHRNYMIRSYALTFSAVTLRTWKLVLSSLFIMEPIHIYMIIAWLGFVPNLLFAEWLIRKKR
jgi:uncharacterized membrane protein